MSVPLGVGILGAGVVTQAIHLPTLATLADRLQVRYVMDVDEALAGDVARRVGARATTDAQVVLDDEDVDIVAICSPPQLHADQVAAACRARKRAVLCEKPLATSAEEARRIAAVARASGVPIVVGAMHAYDPAYVAAAHAWRSHAGAARLVRSIIYLPRNDLMVALATDLLAAPTARRTTAPSTSPEPGAARLRASILGLAIHNIPLVRQFVGSEVEVRAAHVMMPVGYVVTLAASDRVAQLISYMPGAWQPAWLLEAWGADAELRAQFPPSFVRAGSARAEFRNGGVWSVWEYPDNGYQAEWRHLADVVEGRTQPAIPVQTVVDDLLFALDVADGAARLLPEVP